MKPWIGLHLPLYTYPHTSSAQLFDRVVEQARAAESNRFRLVTVMDHLYQIGGIGPEDEPMLEGWSVLNALARETRSVRLGTLVTGVTYRNPALLAKMATTLDITSGGRAILGLGAAWNESEHDGYGYGFPRVGERMDRLDEALTIAKAMFTEDRPSFEGRHYRIHEAHNVPKPVQPGGPPILIGGGGEERTLRIAAKHADMTHWFPLGFDVLRHKTEVLEGYCAEIGRDPSTIERTMATPAIVARDEAAKARLLETVPAERRPYIQGGTPQQAAEVLKRFIDAGFTGFTFNNNYYRTMDQIALIAEVLPLIGG
ncbi:MAG TPA: TIGR03560 family F420-dependent LLM class oxidoreductase [Candidatus Dormibacteraeota bacterium]|nr:TIGR03560 family F420-dependent LLM class oxidoreductase [Candidatus Dormibacteraeota bacterium]